MKSLVPFLSTPGFVTVDFDRRSRFSQAPIVVLLFIGRLEIYPMLALFSPASWKR